MDNNKLTWSLIIIILSSHTLCCLSNEEFRSQVLMTQPQSAIQNTIQPADKNHVKDKCVDNDADACNYQEIALSSKTSSVLNADISVLTEPTDTSVTDPIRTAENVASAETVKFTVEAFGTSVPESQSNNVKKQPDMTVLDTTDDWSHGMNDGDSPFFHVTLLNMFLNALLAEFGFREKPVPEDNRSSDSMKDISISNANESSIEGINVSSGNASENLASGNKTGNETDGDVKVKSKFNCVGRNITDDNSVNVMVVNSSVLQRFLNSDNKNATSNCIIVLFYSPMCHFCSAIAPYYNTLARVFPQLYVVAIDVTFFSSLNAHYGIVAVPTIMLFYQSRAAVRFNHTDRHLEKLIEFITNNTVLLPNSSVEMSPADNEGPFTILYEKNADYLLWFAWTFIIICISHVFFTSQVGKHAVERVYILWQEHQHQHMD